MTKKICLFICIIIFVYCCGGVIYKQLTKNNSFASIPKKMDNIKEYGYTLKSNATEVYKLEFNNLKEILKSDQINYEEYAKSISKLFIIDLYTLSNKTNKYDIGGIEFIYPNSLENYKLNVQDTLNKYLKDNTIQDRNNHLPIVSGVNIDEIKEGTYSLNENEYQSYEIKITWEYSEDLGYETSGELTIVKDNNKLYITEKK